MEIPRSYHVLYFLILTPSIVCSRFCYRFLRMLRMRMQFHAKEDAIPTMVIGAGEAGNTIIREIINSRKVEQERDVVCVIDDDPAKIGTRIRGIPVIGGRECIVDAVEKYHVKSIIFAIPNPSQQGKEGDPADLQRDRRYTFDPAWYLPADQWGSERFHAAQGKDRRSSWAGSR